MYINERMRERIAIERYHGMRDIGASHEYARDIARMPLNAAAKRELQRIRASVAGLADMQAAADYKPKAFRTLACVLPDWCECITCTRRAAYVAQTAIEQGAR